MADEREPMDRESEETNRGYGYRRGRAARDESTSPADEETPSERGARRMNRATDRDSSSRNSRAQSSSRPLASDDYLGVGDACPHCGRPVDPGQARCPHCGHFVRPIYTNPILMGAIVVIVVLVIILTILIGSCRSQQSTTDVQTTTTTTTATTEQTSTQTEQEQQTEEENSGATALQDAISNAQSYVDSNAQSHTYTAASMKSLEDAIASAQAVLDTGSVSQDQASSASTELTQAVSNLVQLTSLSEMTELSYETVQNNAESYVGQQLQMTGIVQTIDSGTASATTSTAADSSADADTTAVTTGATTSGDQTYLVFVANIDAYPLYAVCSDLTTISEGITEGSRVTVGGTLTGTQDYTEADGTTITAPVIEADYVSATN